MDTVGMSVLPLTCYCDITNGIHVLDDIAFACVTLARASIAVPMRKEQLFNPIPGAICCQPWQRQLGDTSTGLAKTNPLNGAGSMYLCDCSPQTENMLNLWSYMLLCAARLASSQSSAVWLRQRRVDTDFFAETFGSAAHGLVE